MQKGLGWTVVGYLYSCLICSVVGPVPVNRPCRRDIDSSRCVDGIRSDGDCRQLDRISLTLDPISIRPDAGRWLAPS
jgi:hypothetical protein